MLKKSILAIIDITINLYITMISVAYNYLSSVNTIMLISVLKCV